MKISNIKQYLGDRAYLVSLALMAVVLLLILVVSAFNIHPGELRVPIRYSFFDQKNYTLDQWYYLLSFPLFAICVAVFHALLSVKLYELKGRLFAISSTVAGTVVLVIALVVFSSIFRVVSFS